MILTARAIAATREADFDQGGIHSKESDHVSIKRSHSGTKGSVA